MPRISVQRPTDPAQLKSVDQISDQINGGAQVLRYSAAGRGRLKVPRGAKAGDQAVRPTERGIALRTFTANGGSREVQITSDSASFIGLQTGTTAPTVDDNFPNEGDFGWYVDTVATKTYLVVTYNGALSTISPSTLGINFTDITGTITAAQHGNFTAIAANDNLHALATTARPGFLSSTFWNRLNDATNAPDPSTLVFRDSNGDTRCRRFNAVTSASGGGIAVDGSIVVRDRQAAIADATGASLANTTATVNLILHALRNSTGHGLISG